MADVAAGHILHATGRLHRRLENSGRLLWIFGDMRLDHAAELTPALADAVDQGIEGNQLPQQLPDPRADPAQAEILAPIHARRHRLAVHFGGDEFGLAEGA